MMKTGAMGRSLRSAVALFLAATLALGVLYPLVVCGVAQAAFPWQANGSIIEVDGVKYGSALVGQSYTGMDHLWGRPTKTDARTFATKSGEPLLWYGPENLSPASEEFGDVVQERIAAVRAAHPGQGENPVPSELVTASGSGFDPHISPAAAEYQVGRIAKAKGMDEEEVRAIIRQCTDRPLLGVIGEARVNVLEVNLMLDGVLKTAINR